MQSANSARNPCHKVRGKTMLFPLEHGPRIPKQCWTAATILSLFSATSLSSKRLARNGSAAPATSTEVSITTRICQAELSFYPRSRTRPNSSLSTTRIGVSGTFNSPVRYLFESGKGVSSPPPPWAPRGSMIKIFLENKAVYSAAKKNMALIEIFRRENLNGDPCWLRYVAFKFLRQPALPVHPEP